MVALQKSTDLWTCLCQRILEGLLRRSAMEKRPKRKANPLPGFVIARMILKYILSAEYIEDIPFREARTILCLTIQYHTLARGGDVKRLRACDLQCVTLKGQNALKITFRTAKNDIQYESRDAFIVEEAGNDCCPVKGSYESKNH